MGRVYSSSFSNVSVSAAQDFFELLPASNKPCRVHSVTLSQGSDLGDAEEEALRVTIQRGHTTSGSGGSTPTPRPMDSNDTAAGAVVEANNTTIASAGTSVTLHSELWNIRIPFVYLPTPETRPRVQNSNLLVVRLEAAPTDAVTISGTIVFEEM